MEVMEFQHKKFSGGPVAHHVRLHTFLEKLNMTLDPVVDATVDQMAAVYHQGNLCPFKKRIFDKMARGETIKVVIVGGSVTYGAELKDRLRQRWSYLFTEILTSEWYTGGFDINNIGVGACNIDVWIYKVKDLKSADMVIVDLSPNDQGFNLQALPLLYETFIQLVDELPNHPAIYFNQAFRGAKLDKNDINIHCPTDYISCCDGEMFCHRWYEMQDFVAITLRKFGIPFVSYRDLVWPDYYHPSSTLNQFWNGMSHPDYKAHALIGKLIAYGFYRQLKESHHYHQINACDDPGKDHYVTNEHKNPAVVSLCPEFITNMQAADTIESKENFAILPNPYLPAPANQQPTPWRYYNDSQLKFGWILETTKSSILQECQSQTLSNSALFASKSSLIDSFICEKAIYSHSLSIPIEFQSDIPKLQLTFLISYSDEMGDIIAWIDDSIDSSIKITGKWDLEYSVRHVATISKELLVTVSAYIKGDNYAMNSLSSGKHILHLSVAHFNDKEKFKWKLMGISTC
jgi:hypothetical protein